MFRLLFRLNRQCCRSHLWAQSTREKHIDFWEEGRYTHCGSIFYIPEVFCDENQDENDYLFFCNLHRMYADCYVECSDTDTKAFQLNE